MKKNFMKTAFAAVCVVAAGMGGFKAYSFANQSQADMLLAENVDALSQNDGSGDGGDTGGDGGGQYQNCSRAKEGKTGACYADDRNDACFTGMWVDEVESYQVAVGSPIVCYHETVHDCPKGSHR